MKNVTKSINASKTSLKRNNTVQKIKFSVKISAINVTKSAGNCRFRHIYSRNPEWKISFFAQCEFLCSKHLPVQNSNRNTIKWCEICSKLTTKILEKRR